MLTQEHLASVDDFLAHRPLAHHSLEEGQFEGAIDAAEDFPTLDQIELEIRAFGALAWRRLSVRLERRRSALQAAAVDAEADAAEPPIVATVEHASGDPASVGGSVDGDYGGLGIGVGADDS